MQVRRKFLQALLYLLSDAVTSYVAWIVFGIVNGEIWNKEGSIDIDILFTAGILSVYWVIVYGIAGLYKKPFRRSRLHELSQVGKFTLIGVLILFFIILLDDPVYKFESYRITFTQYLIIQTAMISVFRFIITTRTNYKIRTRKMGFPTLLIGNGLEAKSIYHELENMRRSLGYFFRGYLSLEQETEGDGLKNLAYQGTLEHLPAIVEREKIEEIIIALEKTDSHKIGEVVEKCSQTQATIKIVPGSYDYIIGSVKSNNILGAPLIEIFPQLMKPWEQVGKRVFDIVVSLIALAILLPVYTILAIAIKLDSEGPILFLQERIGKNGKPFKIIKFRSMYIDAEKFGPALSKEKDPRITKVGLILRKLRLDELPQFWNVLIGDMSLVGPRPERQFYIDQIVKIAPHYRHLHKVRPGITSWGQVKYGYASNVGEMVERLKYDILYMEQMSLALDIKIILYTILVIIEGRGK